MKVSTKETREIQRQIDALKSKQVELFYKKQEIIQRENKKRAEQETLTDKGSLWRKYQTEADSVLLLLLQTLLKNGLSKKHTFEYVLSKTSVTENRINKVYDHNLTPRAKRRTQTY
jgi:hypothetical protein